jgi:hypothetical protein
MSRWREPFAVRYDSTSAQYVCGFPFFRRSNRLRNMSDLLFALATANKNRTVLSDVTEVGLRYIAFRRSTPHQPWTYVRFPLHNS